MTDTLPPLLSEQQIICELEKPVLDSSGLPALLDKTSTRQVGARAWLRL
jgi:hypothetical protein